jgi:hypothetical protein
MIEPVTIGDGGPLAAGTAGAAAGSGTAHSLRRATTRLVATSSASMPTAGTASGTR